MDSDSKRQENQRVLVGEEGAVMIGALLVILFLLAIGIVGILCVVHVHVTIKREFKEKKWMDNSEFDYGHDVRYDYKEY